MNCDEIWSDEVLAWLSVWSEVQMICIWFGWCHCHPVISCFSKIQNGLSFWYWPIQVVLEKRPLNGCVCVCVRVCVTVNCSLWPYYYYYNRFTTLCPGLPRWVGTRRANHSGFCWSRHDGVAATSAEPYASYLHFTPEDNHASTSSVRFLQAGCPSWHPTNSSVKALKATDIWPWPVKITSMVPRWTSMPNTYLKVIV